jgi:hypothetical protein
MTFYKHVKVILIPFNACNLIQYKHFSQNNDKTPISSRLK